ncbi:MAG: hypothetical protein ACRCW2_09790 [Cellulosilyticaceae bacterium]
MKNSKQRGAALLIAVIMMLVLTLVSSHLLTLASTAYRTDQIRRYTSNTSVHSEAGVMQMVNQMNQALLNYGPAFLEPMKGMMAQLTDEEQEVVVCAYAFRWLGAQYFEQIGSEANLSVSGRKRLSYTLETEQAIPGMMTEMRMGSYVKGMKTDSSGWLGTLPPSQVASLSDYKQVGVLLTQLESASREGDLTALRLSLQQLREEMAKAHLVIESIAQTKEGIEIFDTQQRIGRVRLQATEEMGKLIYQAGVSWRESPPQALAQEVFCLGEIVGRDKLVVEGVLRQSSADEGLETVVSDEAVALWRTQVGPPDDGIVYKDTSVTAIDLASLQGTSDASLLILEGDTPKRLYTSRPDHPWRGIILSYSPLVLEGPMLLEGAVLVEGDLEITSEGVRIGQNREVFFEIGDKILQEQLLESGIWHGAGKSDRMLRRDGTFVAEGAVAEVVLEVMYDGHMVDRKGSDAWENK